MVTAKNFYDSYLLHHHRSKAFYLKKLLAEKEFIKAADIKDETWAFDQAQYELSLRIEARSNLFHAIETLFTLYFCLQPDKDGKVDDRRLFYNMSKREHYTEKIRKVASDPTAMDVLNQPVHFQQTTISYGQYLFYFSLKPDVLPDGLAESINAIKAALKILAEEISDTAEYNSYKHALKAVSCIKEFALAKRETMERVMTLDASNSMTYFNEKKNGEMTFTTKVFDTERDFELTHLTSNLIYNIIGTRKASIVHTAPKVAFGYYDKALVEKCAAANTELSHFTIIQTPITSNKPK